MMQFIGGVVVGAVGLFGVQSFTKPDAPEQLRVGALAFAEERSVESVWLFETATGGLVSGSEQAVLFFGYGDNFEECERMVRAYGGLSSATSATCAPVE